MKDAVELLLSKYPSVQQAVAWTEYIVCGIDEDDGDSGWAVMIRARATPDEILIALQIAADESGPTDVPQQVLDSIRAQVRYPQYKTYLAGKLGLT